MRLILCVLATFLLQGCIRTVVYVEPAQTPVPLVPRPILHSGDITFEQAMQDRGYLMRAFRAQEQTVLEYNQMVFDANKANGYPTDPDSIKQEVIDYSTLD